jgi:uncharacterized protein YfaS (alpha-2-macroglobulin family)
VLGACTPKTPQPGIAPSASPDIAAIVNVEVSPEPAPSLPAMIAMISPRGTAESLSQIRVGFTRNLIPLEALESAGETGALAHFSLTPALPGHFRFLTPRLVGFQADVALPVATRVRITIAKGLKDTGGSVLDRDIVWTFATTPLTFEELPGGGNHDPLTPSTRKPAIAVRTNVALDSASLAAHATLVSADGKSTVPLALAPTPTPGPSSSPPPDLRFDASQATYSTTLMPEHELATATNYAIVIAPGVKPQVGNVASTIEVRGAIKTYGDLTFDGVRPTGSIDSPDRFTGGAPQLFFSNPIDRKSVAAAIAIDPAPSDISHALVTSDTNVTISSAVLRPNTLYRIAIKGDLKDQFGQTLGRDASTTFKTGDLAPAFWAPSGKTIFPADRNLSLNIVSTNIKTAHAIFKRVVPTDLIANETPIDPAGGGLLPAAAEWPTLALGGEANREHTMPIPLREKIGGATGVLAYGARAANVSAVGLVQLTNLGVFAQYFPASGFVRVHHLGDGSAVAHASVEVYPSMVERDAADRTAAPRCAQAMTDASGTATFAAAALAVCSASEKRLTLAPSYLTIVREGADWAYVRTDEYTSRGLDASTNWSAGNADARGTIFSDRSLYQPGERAAFTGVGWFLIDGVLTRGHAPLYTITLESPSGDKRDLTRVALNAFGTFSVPFVIPKDAALGSWLIRASAGNGETLTGTFRVAEFKPPNFKVSVALDKTVALRGDTVNATATSTYLFGAPVEGAASLFSVTRSQAYLAPPNRDDFRFGPQWFWPEVTPDAKSDVVQAQTRVDARGKSAQSFTIAADLPYPMTYRVDAQTTDVSNLAVADSATLTALPSSTLIGLKTDFVGTAGLPQTVGIVVTDPDGKAHPGMHVSVLLQRADYVHATSIIEGGDSEITGVTYTTVASAALTSASDPVSASLTPPKAGTYRIRANLAGAKNDATASDAQIWVSGSQDVAWNQPDPNRLTVTLDKTKYTIGDRATALVQSPFRSGDLYVAVVRHGVLWKKVGSVSGAAPTVQFPITAEMLPNAAIEAVLVRRGSVTRNASGNAFARSGFATFDVSLDSKYVKVTAHADRATLAPGAGAHVHFHVVDNAGKPVHGACTVVVANEAILQLTGYRLPDLVQLVYAQQPISTRFADNRESVVLQSPQKPLDKGFGFGGGLSDGGADTRVRHAFSPLAYYAGAILTDANGNADATFTLPDDLTTWRTMVVVATSDGRFGNGETTFVTTKPLLANPIVPQFVRPGDTFEAGVAITNPGKLTGPIDIHGELRGPASFTINGTSQQSIDAHETADPLAHAYRFPTLANGAGNVTATFRATIGSVTDAFAIPLSIIDRATTESVIATGATTAIAHIPLAIAAHVPADSGGLKIELASGLVPDALVSARAIFDRTDPLAETVASRLSAAADLTRLAAMGSIDTVHDATLHVPLELAALAKLQRADGGFASYPGETSSDPYASFAALAALGRAKNAVIAIDTTRLGRAQSFVAAVLADPGQYTWCRNPRCKMTMRLNALSALAAAGDRRTTFLGDLYAHRDTLGIEDRVQLARLLSGAPGYVSQADTMSVGIDQRIYVTGATAILNVPERYAWWSAPTVLHATALQLFIERNAPVERADGMLRSLLALRRNGSWGCACENAAALAAITDLIAHDRTPVNFTATAILASKTLARATFVGPKTRVFTKDVPMAQLPHGTSSLALSRSGSGTLHYAVTYTYRILGPQRGVLAGLRVTREIRTPNADPVLASMGLAYPSSPTTLPPAHVYDVGLQIITDHPVDRVIIEDPLPAGMEAVDTSFATTSTATAARGDRWRIGYQEIHHDRIEAFADRLGPGIYELHYLVRTVTPGTFAWPGARARLADRPEEFGRSAATTLIVR